MVFTDKSTLAEVLEFSEAEKILLKYNVPCLGCPMAQAEMDHLSLGQIAEMYGINLEGLQKDLNEAAQLYKTEKSA